MIELPVTLTSTGSAVSFASPVPLGYTKNKGVYRLLVTAEGEWEGLTIRCFWHLPGGTDPASSLVQDGAVDVPASVTAHPGNGCITFEGSDGVKTVTSADLRYRVGSNSGTDDGTMPEPGTPAWEQLVSETKANADAAEQAKNDAQAAAKGVETAAAKAEEAASAAAKSAQKAETAQKATEQAEAAAAESIAVAKKEALSAISAGEQGALGAVQQAQTTATESVQAAQTAAESAVNAAKTNAVQEVEAAAKPAHAAATKAEEAAERSEQAGIAASNAADDAKRSAGIATGAADDSALNAENAQKSALSAQQSAENAAEIQSAAAASADAAAKSAQEALESKTAAATSEGNAAESAKKAKDIADSLHIDYTTAVNDIAALKTNKADKTELETVKQQVANITPDDTAVDGKPWTSKKIVDSLCQPFEESGNPVQVYPVEGYPLGVKASWEPVQAGSGDPSQDNIRPITGRDAVSVTRCGKNLLNPEENKYYTYRPYGLTINYIGDNKVHLSGTYQEDGGSFVILDTNQKDLAGKGLKITGFTIEGTKQTYTLYGLRTKDETDIAMQAQFAEGDVIDMTVAIVVSQDTPSAYIPYTGQTNTLTLTETVYGGEVDAVSGEGLETWKMLTLDGKTNKFSSGNTYWNLPYNSAVGVGNWYINNIYSSHFPRVFGGNASLDFIYTTKALMTKYFQNADALNDYLAAQYAAGTPVQVCYKLEEPVPFTATGTQPIPALAGVNTILTDADGVVVTGAEDPKHTITELKNAIISLGGNV